MPPSRPYPRLRVTRFSCVDEASVTLAPVTVITGPQGSGKSVVCKLVYFCQKALLDVSKFVEEGLSFSEFCKAQADSFIRWFPPKAWGASQFAIEYNFGKFCVSIRRKAARGRNEVVVQFDGTFQEIYEASTSAWDKVRSSAKRQHEFANTLSIGQSFRRELAAEMVKQFGNSFITEQLYVPAGRSFFTTVGKAVLAFQKSNMFDPITSEFGAMYSVLREVLPYTASSLAPNSARIQSIFGGRLKADRDEIEVSTPDGRTVPSSALSSGQQELLPLWLTLNYFERFVSSRNNYQDTKFLFIEEPEAHLFPAAQAALVEIMVSIINEQRRSRFLIISTHSPYIISKLNNLLVAGRLGFRKKPDRQKKVNNVIPIRSWIRPGEFEAYAIQDRVALSLLENGEVDAQYLDHASEDILEEANRLIDVELGTV